MENIQLDELLLIPWFFILGAVIGSFLNVVVYRLPRSMSLISPSSHCPACNHPIRWFDNIPIVSWLLLGRRCRDCRTPISGRYPFVEAATAVTFAVLASVEFTFKGINLPMREVFYSDNFVIFSWNNPQLYGILLYHLLLLCTLLTAALIEIDRRSVPRSLFVPALAVGLIAPLIWPDLRPVPAWASLPDWISRIADGMAGLAAGGLSGYIAWRIEGAKSPGGMAWGLLAVGVFLGWQAVCILSIFFAMFALAAVVLRKFRKNAGHWPISVWLYTITFAWILAWSQIVNFIKTITF
jgi:leader peptidase (prepilin peptidase) / N-methyltransferase